MPALIGGVVMTVVGAVLVVVVSIVGYVVVPNVITNTIISAKIEEVTLIDDTIQMERFEQVPFPLNFTIRLWTIDNPQEVIEGGVPVMSEVGPYVYKLYQGRLIDNYTEDTLTYRLVDHFEFDPIASYPNTEDDVVTVVNPSYHALLQIAEKTVSPGLMSFLNGLLGDVFGAFNSPIISTRVGDLVLDGIPICQNPGIVSGVVCSIVKSLSEQSINVQETEDYITFSLISYRNGVPSREYVVSRGIENPEDLGRIFQFDGLDSLRYWVDPAGESAGSGPCNMINGTDSGIFAPFVTNDDILYALNTDICRSVGLRHQYDHEYEGIPVKRFAANEWLLANEDGCFCLNTTEGILREDGCPLQGAIELFTCVGTNMVLTYPHFLFADLTYRNGIIGANPQVEEHRIFLDVEPNSGTVIRGAKRAQFNVFMRPVVNITATQNLRTTLTPIFWVEEGMSLPMEFVDEVKSKLLAPLNLVQILVPVLITVSAVVFAAGLIVIVIAKTRKSADLPTTMPATHTAVTR